MGACSVCVSLLISQPCYLFHFSAGKTEVRKCQEGADAAGCGKGIKPSISTLSLVALSHGPWLFLLLLEHLRILPCPLPMSCPGPKAATCEPEHLLGARCTHGPAREGAGFPPLCFCPVAHPALSRAHMLWTAKTLQWPLFIQPADMDLSSPCMPHTRLGPRQTGPGTNSTVMGLPVQWR